MQTTQTPGFGAVASKGFLTLISWKESLLRIEEFELRAKEDVTRNCALGVHEVVVLLRISAITLADIEDGESARFFARNLKVEGGRLGGHLKLAAPSGASGPAGQGGVEGNRLVVKRDVGRSIDTAKSSIH